MMPRTIFLARLLGLFFLLTGIAMLIRRDTMVATVMALLRDEPLLFALGMSALAVGLAMVLMHNVWSGGVLPVVVTLLGWTFVIRGALLLALPPGVAAQLVGALRFDELYYGYAGITLVLGAYMTWAGFRRPHK